MRNGGSSGLVTEPGQGSRLRQVVYLDNHATTPCDPRVVEGMSPVL